MKRKHKLNSCTEKNSIKHRMAVLPRQYQKKNISDPCTFHALLLTNLRRKSWKKFDKYLTSSSNFDKQFFTYSCSRCSSRHSLLNLTLRYNPPLKVVQNLTKLCPEVVFEADCIGKFPLHHSLEYGASFQVAEYLLKLNPSAADKRNIFGYTPLHLLFDDDAMSSISCNGHQEEQYVLKMIEMFCAIKPSSVLVDDMEERSILEHVIENEFNYASVKKVQRLTKHATFM